MLTIVNIQCIMLCTSFCFNYFLILTTMKHRKRFRFLHHYNVTFLSEINLFRLNEMPMFDPMLQAVCFLLDLIVKSSA